MVFDCVSNLIVINYCIKVSFEEKCVLFNFCYKKWFKILYWKIFDDFIFFNEGFNGVD